MNKFRLLLWALIILLFVIFIILVYLLINQSRRAKNPAFRVSHPKIITPSQSEVLPNQSLKPIRVKYSWNSKRMAWTSATSDDLAAKSVADSISIEFTEDLCSRPVNSACGFKENAGKFTDITASVSYVKELLNAKVWITMQLYQDDSFTPVEWKTKEEEFNPNVPIRIIYDDGDKYVFPIQEALFSRGWGVDPYTKGLIFFIAPKKRAEKDWYDAILSGALEEVTNTRWWTNLINKEQEDKFLQLWFGNEIERIKLSPEEGSTLVTF